MANRRKRSGWRPTDWTQSRSVRGGFRDSRDDFSVEKTGEPDGLLTISSRVAIASSVSRCNYLYIAQIIQSFQLLQIILTIFHQSPTYLPNARGMFTERSIELRLFPLKPSKAPGGAHVGIGTLLNVQLVRFNFGYVVVSASSSSRNTRETSDAIDRPYVAQSSDNRMSFQKKRCDPPRKEHPRALRPSSLERRLSVGNSSVEVCLDPREVP